MREGTGTTEWVRSADGTPVAFERVGRGPAVVVAGGALSDRGSFRGLAGRLAHRATVVTYDRRGRGESGDRSPHQVADEIDDLRAVCAAIGSPALLYGHSSGGLLLLAAVAGGLRVGRLALYEPPYLAGGRTRELPVDLASRVAALASAGRRAEAVTTFLRGGVGMAPEAVAALEAGGAWAGMVGLAHTLAYDVALCVGEEAVGDVEASRVEVPTLVLAGGASHGTIRLAAEDLLDALPEARLRVVDGEGHVVSGTVLAPVLEELLAAGEGP